MNNPLQTTRTPPRRRLLKTGFPLVLLTLGVLLLDASASELHASEIDFALPWQRLTVVGSDEPTAVEQRYLELLTDRLRRIDGVEVEAVQDLSTDVRRDGLVLLVGRPSNHAALAHKLSAWRVPKPTEKNPGPEGFVLRSQPLEGGGVTVLAAGVDERGVLYAIGEFLRQIEERGDGVVFPSQLDIRTAPAFEIRGTEPRQGHTVRELTGTRDWTEEERQDYLLDYALAGANTFAYEYELPARYGLKSLVGHCPNVGSGPEEWQAMEAIGRTGYLCPSVPEAREHLLKSCENRFKNAPPWDYVRMNSGDGGGCECDRCAPYGGTYIRLAADMAQIIHKYLPNAKIFCTNQKLDNAGEEAIFNYLNEKPRPWLAAICYAPGSNAMSFQPGRRQDHRMDLFRYPAFGEYDRYLREMLHRLPRQQDIVFFTGLTHWIYSEYGLVTGPFPPDRNYETPPHWSRHIYNKRPDAALVRVYNRRTFHVRPRAYYRAFQETMRYSIGDVTYSEGQHDHFNQWMWQRLLWNPHQSVEEVVSEYARTWFGRDAAQAMAKAIFQLEKNYSTPLATNEGIDRLILLVTEAGLAMPPHLKAKNVLWRQYMEKALLDKYVQLRLRRQLALEADVMEVLSAADRGERDAEAALAIAAERFAAAIESAEMKRLRAEADRLGSETDRLLGVRSDGAFNLEQDLVGLGWLRQQVSVAHKLDSGDERRRAIAAIVHYEDPGEGGFYDNPGVPGGAPRLVYGFPRRFRAGTFRASQSSFAYTTDEQRGVTFAYDGLDRESSYRIRFTLARWERPNRPGRRPRPKFQKTQSIYADGHALAQDLELPANDPSFFEFDIPADLTRDGQLEVWFEKEKGVGEGTQAEKTIWRVAGGWGTLCSEVWLMKRPSGS